MTGPWDPASEIEDYALTLDLKTLGWKVKAGREFAYTQVPQTFRKLWRQRIRWGRGGFTEVRKRGWTWATWYDWCAYGVYGVNFAGRIVCLSMILTGLLLGFGYHWAAWGLIPMALGWIDRMQSMWRLPDRTWRDVALSAALIPEDLYGLMLEVCTARAIWLSFTNARGNW